MSSPILLRSCDGVLFEVEEAVAMKLQTVAFMIEDGCAISEIPLPNVDSKTLAKVIEYCKKHVSSNKNNDNDEDDGLKLWDGEYITDVGDTALTDLLMAANYLNVEGLFALVCQTIADMMKGKSPEELRKTFNIKNDFTPEQEEEIRKKDGWAF